MNRLQKKCLIATAGFHLLLLVILFVGPAFFTPKPKVDDSQVLDVIPANLVDAAINSGVNHAQPPPPNPILTPPQQPQPVPPTPAPKIVQPAPQPTIAERLEKLFTPESIKSVPVEPQPQTPKINLHVVTHNVPKTSTPVKPKDNSQTIKNTVANLRDKFSKPTEVNAPGDSSVAYANYGTVVVSVYHNAWIAPDEMANDSAVVKFSVTIANDGTVTSAQIVTPSGDANVDAAVQRMLNRVASIAPFPEGATEKERTYTINFNASRTTE